MPPPPAHGSSADSDNILINLIKQFLFAHSQVGPHLHLHLTGTSRPNFPFPALRRGSHCLPSDEPKDTMNAGINPKSIIQCFRLSVCRMKCGIESAIGHFKA